MFNVIKILYLILFYLIYRITDIILLLVLLVQTILNIFSGEPSESIKLFGKSLGVYLQQISEFLSYASEEKPFPFSDWPVPVSSSTDDAVSNSESNVAHVFDDQEPASIVSANGGDLEPSESESKTN
tara:strand:- start:451 stop:831 length:381 start_codon:yes stop_codon:yes gene_type:complete